MGSMMEREHMEGNGMPTDRLRGVDEFLELLDDARADERRVARVGQRLARHVAEEGASLVGTLLDLAERGSTVTVRSAWGRAHTGTLALVAADFFVLRTGQGDRWLARQGLTSVRPDPGEHHLAASGDRSAADLLLVEALGRIAPDRPRLAFVLDGGELLAGELRAVGADVLTVRLDGGPGRIAYVSGGSLREVFRSG
jgi:hypothetical protein